MTASIKTLYKHPAIRRDIAEALFTMNEKINDAVNDAIDADVPLLLISSVLNAHNAFNSAMLIQEGEDDAADD